MGDGLKLVLQRVERAKEQRADLEREMRAWAKAGAYEVVSHFDEQSGYTIFRLESVAEATPKITALIAETIHSLRTALDNLAYQLFLVCRTDPADEGEHVFFPIYDDTKPLKSNPFRPVKSFRNEIVDMFRKINPCKTGNHLLWVLHRLDIVDKHRRILTCTLVHNSVYFRDAQKQLLIEAGYPDMLPVLELWAARFLTSPRTGKRAQVGDVLFVGMPGDEEVNKKLKFTFDISFDEPGIIEGESIVKTIDEMVVLVEGIVSSFEPFLI
jgi:hypothetical protein